MTHEIKCWPQYYARVIDGSKTFELRDNDRGYQPGDLVYMREWDPTTHSVDDGATGYYKEPIGYTDRACEFIVGYVLPIDDRRVVFSIKELRLK